MSESITEHYYSEYRTNIVFLIINAISKGTQIYLFLKKGINIPPRIPDSSPGKGVDVTQSRWSRGCWRGGAIADCVLRRSTGQLEFYFPTLDV